MKVRWCPVYPSPSNVCNHGIPWNMACLLCKRLTGFVGVGPALQVLAGAAGE